MARPPIKCVIFYKSFSVMNVYHVCFCLSLARPPSRCDINIVLRVIIINKKKVYSLTFNSLKFRSFILIKHLVFMYVCIHSFNNSFKAPGWKIITRHFIELINCLAINILVQRNSYWSHIDSSREGYWSSIGSSRRLT